MHAYESLGSIEEKLGGFTEYQRLFLLAIRVREKPFSVEEAQQELSLSRAEQDNLVLMLNMLLWPLHCIVVKASDHYYFVDRRANYSPQ